MTVRVDLVFVPGFVSHVECDWEEPAFARFLRRLASFSRLILFDKRGTGLSDRVPRALPTLEERWTTCARSWTRPARASGDCSGVSEGGPLSLLFAATHPERDSAARAHLRTYARSPRAPDYPWGGATLRSH